jgi:hypothetical protein
MTFNCMLFKYNDSLHDDAVKFEYKHLYAVLDLAGNLPACIVRQLIHDHLLN